LIADLAERQLIQQLYIRVCRDSGFRFDAVRAAQFVGEMLNTSALVVWLAMPSFSVMEEIAAGRHPAARRPTWKRTGSTM
jgi:hypothetical protein